MIVDFSVQNFRSIKEMQTLNMTAANITSKYKEVDDNNLITVSEKLSLLKTKAIYGANASGKSNIIKALVAFISIVQNSFKNDNALNDIEVFRLSTETEGAPAYFQLSFILNHVLYRYGFEATRKRIKSEWLFGTPGKKEVQFFTRVANNVEINGKQFKEGNKILSLGDEENSMVRENSLFLTIVKSFSNSVARELVDYISSIIVIPGIMSVDWQMYKIAEHELSDEDNRRKMANMLNLFDTEISDIDRYEFESNIDGEKRAMTMTKHKKYDANLKENGVENFFMIVNESEGTKKMFEVSPLILKSLHENRPLIMDEFDARFHPLLSKKIVELFNSQNNKESQLIFATHDTNLLDAKLLRRDQISFVEKDKYGASHTYSLVDFKGVRNDASFEKKIIYPENTALFLF